MVENSQISKFNNMRNYLKTKSIDVTYQHFFYLHYCL